MNRYLRLFLCLPLLATTACAADAIAGPELAPEPEAEAVAQAAAQPQTVKEAAPAPTSVLSGPLCARQRSIPDPGKEPLYIVDGVVVLTLAGLDNDDIQLIEVIRPEAATALYGNRASRGVILITTRGAPSFPR